MSESVRPQRQQPTKLPRPWDSPGKNTGVGCHFLLQCMKVKRESDVAQSCPTLRDPMDCSLPGSSIHGIFQKRVLEWGAIAFSSYFFCTPSFPSGTLIIYNDCMILSHSSLISLFIYLILFSLWVIPQIFSVAKPARLVIFSFAISNWLLITYKISNTFFTLY